MARSRATVYAAMWADPDWRALTPGAQHAYLMLLSQSSVSLAGALDYLPQRWAGYASSLTENDLEVSVEELEDAGFVAVDLTTLELVIRTFVRHDLGDRPNANIVKGMWSAWAAILSPELRGVIVDNIPDHLWEGKITPPATAVSMRAERASERASERSLQRSSERAPEPTATRYPLPPSAEPAVVGRCDGGPGQVVHSDQASSHVAFTTAKEVAPVGIAAAREVLTAKATT